MINATTTKPPLSEAEAQAQFLQTLERIASALEKQNDLLKENTWALGGISNRIEDVMGCMR